MTTPLRTRDPGPELPGLAESLERASAQPVDLASVLAGVEGRVVRLRRRRRQRAVAAAGALAAVVVAGGLTWTLLPEDGAGRVAAPPTPTASQTDPGPTVSTSGPAPTTPAVDRAFVPDAVIPTATDVGAGRELTNDLGQYADVPVVMGQGCDPPSPGLAPVGGRTAGYFDPRDPGAGSVDITVTVFAEGAGGDALTEAATDTGRCRWVDDVTSAGAGWEDGSRFVVRGEDVFGAPVFRAVAREGDVLVGVKVVDVRGAEAAQADAQRLAELVLERARTAMPAAAGG